MITLSIANATILFLLGIIHFYWVVGGTWGFSNTLPTNLEGERVLNPKKTDSAIAGIGLLSFAIYFLIYGNLININLPSWLFNYGVWVISGIFLLRAIGDFKYVGFFKSPKTTEFAKLDRKYYSPLCLFISIIGLLMIFIH